MRPAGKTLPIGAAALAALALLLAGCGAKPPRNFADTVAPAAPNYDQQSAWLAFPGRGGLERSTTPGVRPVEEATAPADVFFIHPTTYLKNDIYNAAIDAPTTYGDPVLLNQASAFNGCCRIFAPHYRQASLDSLNKTQGAVDLAYGDVRRAFQWYMAHENKGRPFIIASHSQGSGHAVRLLQDEVLGTPAARLMVAAYVVGAYAPGDFGTLGLPTCDAADQTGCIVSWNTSETGRTDAYILTKKSHSWWRGANRPATAATAICVNPLTWTEAGAAPASANLGALPFPGNGGGGVRPAIALPSLAPHVTGAECRDTLLYVHVPVFTGGFHNLLSWLYGSYHVFDYGLFYQNIRQNAGQRVSAWTRRAADGPQQQ